MLKKYLTILLGTFFITNITFAGIDKTIHLALIADKASGLDKSPLISLLEVELSQKDGVQLLERAAIDKILEEQKLQLIFSAKGVSDRITLGKLLKADLLILLKKNTTNEIQKLDIIIVETTMGIRYSINTIAWPDNPKEGVKKITESIDSALEKYKNGINEICAVPPFISNDLSHQYDYLQTAYARLIEQILLQYKGVVVVELEEARAIAQELILTSAKIQIKRPLPIYILGEYRNNGIGENRRVSMKLSFKRDDLELQTIDKKDIAAQEIGLLLHEQLSKLFEAVNKKKYDSLDNTNEAILLAQRADEFISISSWNEALSMIEASLLVDSNQPDLHYKAVYTLSNIIDLSYQPYNIDNFIQKAIVGLNYYKLGIAHIESFLLSKKFGSEINDFISAFWYSPSYIIGHTYSLLEEMVSHLNEEQHEKLYIVEKMIEEINKEQREILFRVMDIKAHLGELTDATADFFCGFLFYHIGKVNETQEENYNDRLRAIRMIQNLPRARYLTIQLSRISEQLEDSAYEKFLNQVAEIPNVNVKAGADELKLWREKELASRKKQPQYYPTVNKPVEDSKSKDISFKQLILTSDYSGIPGSFNSDISGWLACDNKIDFAWALKEIFIMKKEGIMKIIFHSDKQVFNVTNPCFDGKYAWFPVLTGSGISNKDSALVLAINPVTEEIIEFNEKDGLPSTMNNPCSAALSSGEICVASGFEGRSWCAILNISDNYKKSVRIIHEARQNIIEHNIKPEDGFNPNIFYYPRFAKVIFDPNDKSNKRIIIGRSSKIVYVDIHPLIINPETGDVNVLSNTMASQLYNNNLACYRGSLYWAFDNTGWLGNSPNLSRISFDNLKEATALKEVPESCDCVAFIGDTIHIVGDNWWMAKSFEDSFIKLNVKIPPYWHYRKLYDSSHYGKIIIVDRKPFQVIFNKILRNNQY